MNINEYLLDNPKMVETLFTKVFGKYMLRYYDQADYVVDFSTNEDTSYQDANNKRIVIALNNVITMLQRNIHVLAVAYHELAHTLYTDNEIRDKITRKALQVILEDVLNRDDLTENEKHFVRQEIYESNYAHNIWNVLEDTRIERLLVEDFVFLKEIVEPLKTMIDHHNNDLFMWRTEQGNPKQIIVDESEAFCSKKKTSQLAKAKNIATIFKELFLQGIIDQVLSSTRNQPKPDLSSDHDTIKNYDKDNAAREKTHSASRIKSMQDNYDYKQEQIKRLEKRIESIEKFKEDVEQDEGRINKEATLTTATNEINDTINMIEDTQERMQEIAKEYLELCGKDITQKDDIYKQLEDIKKIDISNPLDTAIKDILFKSQNTIIENQESLEYNRSVEEYNKVIPQHRLQKAKLYYNPKQNLRQGITASQTKKYSLDISNKVNVGRIVSSKANKTAPQVFYNRGKDITFTRKVVVFEDVSSSTTDFAHVFSSIAYSLSQAFDSVEWWGYGDKLFLKKPQDYKYQTRDLGTQQGLNIHGTQASRLLSVMKKYKNLDYTYVIITDGDMSSVFRDKDTWDYFKNKTVVTGFLTKDIKTNSPHHIDLLSEIAKSNGYYPDEQDDLQDIINYAQINYHTFNDEVKLMPIIYKGINSVMQHVKNRLK